MPTPAATLQVSTPTFTAAAAGTAEPAMPIAAARRVGIIQDFIDMSVTSQIGNGIRNEHGRWQAPLARAGAKIRLAAEYVEAVLAQRGKRASGRRRSNWVRACSQ